MEQPKPRQAKEPAIPVNNEVHVQRDTKDYIGESLMIVFSVLLALGLTELVTYFHEKSETRELLENIRLEVKDNRQNTIEQYKYQTMVMKNIDSAVANPQYAAKIIEGGHFHFPMLAPKGGLLHDVTNTAWEVAKSRNIASRVSFGLIKQLTKIYDQQTRIMKLEDELAKIILTPSAHDIKNSRVTLILLHDSYYGWAYARTPDLLRDYDDTLRMLSDK